MKKNSSGSMLQFIYGKNTVAARLRSGHPIRALWIHSDFDDKALLNLSRQQGIVPKTATKEELDRFVNQQPHQGIVAEIDGYEFLSLEQLVRSLNGTSNPLVVILDKIEDPHNVGAILRTCDALGVQGLIVPLHGGAPMNATVAKVSTGAIEFVSMAQVTNLTAAIKFLKQNGFWIVGAEATEKSVDFRTVDYRVPIALVIGSEGFGISRLVKEQCDYLVKIPMVGYVNSLNASVAAALMIQQIQTNRGFSQ